MIAAITYSYTLALVGLLLTPRLTCNAYGNNSAKNESYG